MDSFRTDAVEQESGRFCCSGSLPGSRLARAASGPRPSGGTGYCGTRGGPRRA